MTPRRDRYDLLVIGGGPAGATAALRAARNGLSVAVIERDPHPRFHIGESFLPRNLGLIKELGLADRLARIPQVPKKGASFAFGCEETPTDFWFTAPNDRAERWAFNLERAPFDEMLADAASEAGADVFQGPAVKQILRLADGDVAIATTDGEFRGRCLIDASGQGTVLGRHLGTRRQLPDLAKVAYFEHFRAVHRRPGDLDGSPLIIMCRDGWFWFIPLDAERTSVGLVMDAAQAKSVGVPAARMLAWGLERCPLARTLTEHAQGPDTNRVTADFSYTCAPYAGPGYFLAGDAATFIDPIFSTGVCLGMMSGVQAADGVAAILSGRRRPDRVRREYQRLVNRSSSILFRMVRRYYRHSFRELFLNGQGPIGVHRAVLWTLAGHIFPRPLLHQSLRVRLFELLIELNEFVPLVPRRRSFSLLSAQPVPSHELRRGRARAKAGAA